MPASMNDAANKSEKCVCPHKNKQKVSADDETSDIEPQLFHPSQVEPGGTGHISKNTPTKSSPTAQL